MSAHMPSIVVLENHLLLRECLVSLMSQYPFDAVRSVSGPDELSGLTPQLGDHPTIIVLLGIRLSAEDAILEAKRVRGVWDSPKICYLCDKLSTPDVQGLLGSEIDACIPLLASSDTLFKAIELVATENIESVMMLASAEDGGSPDEEPVPLAPAHIWMDSCQDSQARKRQVVALARAPLDTGAVHFEPIPQLSERERQILRGLTLGQANKTIARIYNITEAAVKLHMTSILRKIRVTNRTQAAIWAMEHERVF